jgi:hypothetical protein
MRPLLCGLFLVIYAVVGAQTQYVVTADEDVNQLLNRFSEINETTDVVDGWRVQILATTDRRQLETAEADFQETYPSIPVDWVHNSPYYKLRAGAFFTRPEADRLRQRLSQDIEGVYLVRDEIEESEILKMY